MNAKSKYIIFTILFSIFHTGLFATTRTISQSDVITLTSGYIDNMNEVWNVSGPVTNKALVITYSIGTESNYDFFTINSVDDNGNVVSLLVKTSGTRSGTVVTTLPNGRAQIVFTSDGSACYASNPSVYSGINVSIAVENPVVNNNSMQVMGNAYINSRVGIGTTTPTKKLEIVEGVGGRFSFSAVNCTSGYEIAQTIDDAGYKLNIGTTVRDYRIAIAGSDKFMITAGGIVGIGTTTPLASSKLDVNGEIRSNLNSSTSNIRMVSGGYGCMLRNDALNTYLLLTNNGDANGGWNNLRPLYVNNASGDVYLANEKFKIAHSTGNVIASGKMGIGLIDAASKLAVSPADELLTVNGTIHAKEVKVDLTGSLADYVFDPTYTLMPLHQVEQFVKTNNHLPEIPSAAEISKNGMNMGEMQNKLLQKVEELTLYVIEQQKQIEELKQGMKK